MIRLRTDSFGFLILLVVLSLAAGYGWGAWVLPPYNSDHLGCDACHHAILIHCQTLTDPSEREFTAGGLADYPQTSHWLAARLLPLLDNDPYKAMRAVAFAVVLLLLSAQFALLRTAMPAGSAFLALGTWQLFCYQTNTANPQWFCVSYFFSQAVGMAAAWLALVFATGPENTRGVGRIPFVVAVLLAALAYLCHLVSGVVILGGLGLHALIRLTRCRDREGCFRLCLIVALGLAVIVGTGQLAHMGRSRTDDGSVPVKSMPLLLCWMPILPLALVLRGRRWLEPGPRERSEQVLDLLTCVLFVSAALQAYCAVEWLMGKAALYSVKKFFYVLFPVATLMVFLAGARRLEIWRWRERLRARLPGLAMLKLPAGVALSVLLVYLNFRIFVGNELLHSCPDPARNPVRVAERLSPPERSQARPHSSWRSDLVYFDPAMPQSSVFVNIVGLHRAWGDAYQVKDTLRDWDPDSGPAPLPRDRIHYSELLLPGRI